MADLESYRGRWFIVKIGGELALDPLRLAQSVGEAVKQFTHAGIKVAVVHGGGPQATELSAKLGLQTKQLAGQRVTDAATLEVMKMALAGQVSVSIASAFRLAQVSAIATSGVSAGLVDASRRPSVTVDGMAVDYGLVGDVTAVNVTLFEKLASIGVVPLIGSLAGDASGHVYNVNADTVATRLASTLRAAKLFLVSNVPGVLRDRNDPSSRISSLSRVEAERSIADGVISGGMIPKVQESLSMLDEGIEAIHIVGTEPVTAILDEVREPGSRGTVFGGPPPRAT